MNWPLSFLTFVIMLVSVSMGRIALGASLGRAAGAVGRRELVPRIGAATIGIFALVLLIGPRLD